MRLRRGAVWKRTPRLDHSRNLEVTSSVTKTTCVARPMSLYCSELGLGTMSDRMAAPSGGATPTQRSPDCTRVSKATLKPSWVGVAPPDGAAILSLIVPKPNSEQYKLIGRATQIVFVTEDVTAKFQQWRS